MRLRAQIRIDLEAASFAEAAAHQQRVEEVFAEVQRRFSQAVLDFKQRRERVRTGGGSQDRRIVHYTGRMRDYE